MATSALCRPSVKGVVGRGDCSLGVGITISLRSSSSFGCREKEPRTAGPASREQDRDDGAAGSVRWRLRAGAEATARYTADSGHTVASGGATEPLAGDERAGG